ncbi:MAG: EamA family transporter [Rhodospirillaceae bacterium]|nr:EamA family transporter [Rhodospirillaceae bacterium]
MPRGFIGIFLTLLATCFGVLTGLIVKAIGTEIALISLLMYRFLFSMPVLTGAAVAARRSQFLQINAKWTLAIRIVFGCAAMACWFTSIRLLPLGQATALLQTSVIFVTILSPFLLGERIGIFRWSAVVTGMLGIVLLTNPFSSGFSGNVIFGLMGALAGAGLSIFLRRLGKVDHPFSVAVWYNGAGSVMLTLLVVTMVVAEGDATLFALSPDVLQLLLLLGVVAAGLQLCITSAFRFAEAVVISSMRYLQIPMAAFVAYLVFDEVMATVELIGAAVVIVSCVFIAWREFVRARDRQTINSTDAA